MPHSSISLNHHNSFTNAEPASASTFAWDFTLTNPHQVAPAIELADAFSVGRKKPHATPDPASSALRHHHHPLLERWPSMAPQMQKCTASTTASLRAAAFSKAFVKDVAVTVAISLDVGIRTVISPGPLHTPQASSFRYMGRRRRRCHRRPRRTTRPTAFSKGIELVAITVAVPGSDAVSTAMPHSSRMFRHSRSLLQGCLHIPPRRSRPGPLHTPQASSSNTWVDVVADAISVRIGLTRPSTFRGHQAGCRTVAVPRDAVSAADAALVGLKSLPLSSVADRIGTPSNQCILTAPSLLQSQSPPYRKQTLQMPAISKCTSHMP